MKLIIDITWAWDRNSFHARTKKWAGMMIAALIFGIPIRASHAQDLQQPKLNTAYKIIAKHSGKCLEVENAGKQDWAQLIQNTYRGGDHQKWIFKPAGTHGNWPCYQIIAVHSGKCMEIPDAGMENHKLVMQNTWTGGNHQKWIMRPVGRYYYEITPLHSGKCVEVMGASQKDKFVVAQFDCHKQDHQLWKLEEVNPVLPSNSPIQAKYNELGRAKGFLGMSTTEERSTPDGVGKFRHFEGGSIYWHPKTGAHEVHGDIRKKWSELGWEKSFLGYPTTDEIATPDKVGRFNHFQGGSIYWHPQTGAHEVHGDIRKKWSELGWERSYLGYPTTDEMAAPDKVGRFNHFQGGSIYWHPQTGVRVERGNSRK